MDSRTPQIITNVTFERERGVHAIQVTHDVAHAVMAIDSEACPTHAAGVQFLLRALNDAQIPLFLIKLHRTAITAGLAGVYLPKLEEAMAREGIRVKTRRDLSLIIVKAALMRETSGVMVQISDALVAAKANLFQTGDSHNSVQCLIEADRTDAALSELCKTFHLEASAVIESPLTEERAR